MTDVDQRIAAAQLADDLERIVRRDTHHLRKVGHDNLADEIARLASRARAISEEQQKDTNEPAA